MSDDWDVIGQKAPPLPDPTSAPISNATARAPAGSSSIPPLPDDTDQRLIARAAVAEGDKDNPQSYQNIAGVIYNRMQRTGKTAAQVLAEPDQFEAYQNGHIQKVDVSSPQFQAALSAAAPVLSGEVKVPYDSFYQPDIVAQRGVKPPFDAATGTKIGSQVFGTGYAGQASDLTPDEQAAWDRLYGGGTPQMAEGGKPVGNAPDAVAQTQKFLVLHGLQDKSAPAGTSTNPYGATPDRSIPDTPGTWFISPGGQLRMRGSDVSDYIPSLRQSVQAREAAANQPLPNRLMEGFGQGLNDVVSGANKLFGGGLAVDPRAQAFAQAQGQPSAYDIAQGSLGVQADQRNAYNLLHSGDPGAGAGRFAGQTVGAAVPIALGAEALGGAGPIGEFLAGASRGNPLLVGASRTAGGALQGAETGGLLSATSDQPVAPQLGAGALTGGVAAPLLSGLGTAGTGIANKLLGGGEVNPNVASLAQTAIDKYGIPLRSGQIRGASGDRAAWVGDSNLLGSSPKFQANNDAQKQAWMKGFTSQYADPTGDVSQDALVANRDRIGGGMNDIAERTTIPPATITDTLARIDGIRGEADQVLGDNELKPLDKLIANIKSAIQPDGSMSGETWKALTQKKSALRSAIDKGDSNYPQQIYGALQDALSASAAPGDAEALSNLRWQYKNLMVASKLASKADVNGVISPALLRGAVISNFNNPAMDGAGDWPELAKIGQTFMKEPPNSFSADRAKDMLGGLTALLGAGGEGAAYYLHNPQLAIGTAAGLLGSVAAKKGLNALKERALGPESVNALLRTPQPSGPVGNLLQGGGNLALNVANGAYIPASVAANRLLLQDNQAR